MNVTHDSAGFPLIFQPARVDHELKMLVHQSSIVLDYPDAREKPGSSALWIGAHHHLNREEVAELIGHLRAWLDTGDLSGEWRGERRADDSDHRLN